MKCQYAVALAVAGFGLGAITTQGLHAQAKAPVYLVTKITVNDVVDGAHSAASSAIG